MTTEALAALAAFALATSLTPGPNNLMLMASGVNFGFRRSIPHMLGIGIGFTIMVLLVGVGLARLFAAVPALHTVLKVVSVAYLLWLAWRIAHAARPEGPAGKARPLSFVEAALFQWVNPKAWAMALTAITVYAEGGGYRAVALTALVFGAINLPSVSLWTLLGKGIGRLLANPARRTWFNRAMAALLLLSVAPML